MLERDKKVLLALDGTEGSYENGRTTAYLSRLTALHHETVYQGLYNLRCDGLVHNPKHRRWALTAKGGAAIRAIVEPRP